jgi:hypothetical protein
MEMIRVRYSQDESAGGVPGICASIERGSDVVGILLIVSHCLLSYNRMPRGGYASLKPRCVHPHVQHRTNLNTTLCGGGNFRACLVVQLT